MLVSDYIRQVADILFHLPERDINAVIDVLKKARADGRRIFIMGNGGSGATASHITGDLTKVGIDAICLNDNMPTFSGWANDEGYPEVFAGPLQKVLQKRDVVMVLSGSGHSANIVAALSTCKSLGGVSIALVGQVYNEAGGMAAGIADVVVIVPSKNMLQVEDVHLVIGHMIAQALRD